MDLSQTQVNQIINMYMNNIDIEIIMQTIHSNEKDIRTVLKEQQLDRHYNIFSDELYQRIIKLYQDGHTQKYIKETLLIGEPVIRKTLKLNNIHMRTSSQCNQKYKRNSHYFDKIDTPNKAYILGQLYADGNNFTNHNAITLSLQETDKQLLEDIKSEIQYTGPLRVRELHKHNENHKNNYVLCINDEIMSKQLSKLGVVDQKSLKITFPTFLPNTLVHHFIRGYFDGDGCIYYDRKHNKWRTSTVGTVDFCQHLSDLLYTFTCKNNIYHPKQCNKNTVVLQTGGK